MDARRRGKRGSGKTSQGCRPSRDYEQMHAQGASEAGRVISIKDRAVDLLTKGFGAGVLQGIWELDESLMVGVRFPREVANLK